MKKILFFVLLSIVLINYAYSKTDKNPSWILAPYSYDEKEVGKGINKMIEKGYYPVGLDLTEGKYIYILYSKNSKIKSKEWAFYEFEDLKTVNSKMAVFLKKGFVPVDFAIKKHSMYVLFLKDKKLKPVGFQIRSIFFKDKNKKEKSIKVIEKEIFNMISDYQKLDYNPFGISIFDETLNLLVVKFKNKKRIINNFSFISYPNDGKTLFKETDSIIKDKGVSPWAITLDKDKSIWLAYIK